nr:uncharacterized protein LOC109167533 [Ipomoea batatas]
MAKSNHIRSISFPSRSHPSIQKVEEELTMLKALQVSATPEAATISSGLLGLEQLYKCMDDLLNLPQTLHTLSQHQNKKLVDGLLEKSVKLLDLCGLARDSASQLKENLRDIQSSQRRKKEDSSVESNITQYTSFVKKMSKDAKKSIAAIKKIDDKIDGSTPLDVHHDISAVIRALREASAVSLSIFQLVLLFLSVPVLKPKPSRSSSFPSISHPSIQKVEEELNKLKTLQVSSIPEATTICTGLFGLEQLYTCIDDLLILPQTLQAITQYQNKKWVDDLLEKSVRLLDTCSLARDCISQLKEHLRDLQSSLRRRKGDSSTEASITRYTSFIKKMNKDAKKSISALKKMDDEIDGSTALDVHHDISAVIRSLREAIAVSISIFQFVLHFLSVPVLKPKPSRWSLVSKLVQSGRVASEYQHDNTCNLETLEAQLEAIENQMESIFRCLIKLRSSLLNIISC